MFFDFTSCFYTQPFSAPSFPPSLPIPNHIDTQTQREHGRKAQLSNIQAARAVADIIRTTLGPRAMLKMILDPTGHIQLTNDGNTILREVCYCNYLHLFVFVFTRFYSILICSFVSHPFFLPPLL
jgi:hypothetical protein